MDEKLYNEQKNLDEKLYNEQKNQEKNVRMHVFECRKALLKNIECPFTQIPFISKKK